MSVHNPTNSTESNSIVFKYSIRSTEPKVSFSKIFLCPLNISFGIS